MPRTIAENLADISKSAGKLNYFAQQASSQIKAVEQFLTEHPVLIETWGEKFGDGYQLGYARDDEGKWGLIALNADPAKPVKRALLGLSRELRIAALEFLPALFEKIAAAAREAEAKATKNAAEMLRIAQEINRALPERPAPPPDTGPSSQIRPGSRTLSERSAAPDAGPSSQLRPGSRMMPERPGAPDTHVRPGSGHNIAKR